MKRVLIVGATSAIAIACARRWAGEKACFALVGRNAGKLRQVTEDLRVRGAADVSVHVLDLMDFDSHAAIVQACFEVLGEVDIALVAHGLLSDQALCQHDATAARLEFDTNATSVIGIVTHLAARMEQVGNGTLAVISSVAGDRGRASNYVYGAAKAAVSTFCEGLRLRLHPRGVHVLTIKPGPVDTPMTAGMKLPAALTASADQVAQDIVRAAARGGGTLYTPWFWRPIMALVKAMPAFVMMRVRR
jgi:decaprenylphospho-beta-D-erythro-pentofuranosid-2-ulose 2-reductase